MQLETDNIKTHLGGVMRSQITSNTVGWISSLFQSSKFGAVCALSFSLVLSACGDGGNSVTDNVAADPAGSDGVAPTLTAVTLTTVESGLQFAELGETVKVSFTASESLLKPSLTINGVAVDVSGQHNSWSGARTMTADDADGIVTFNVSFTDVSGEAGTDVSASTLASNEAGKKGSWAEIEYCADGSCVAVPVVQSLLDFEDNLLDYNWKDIGTPTGDNPEGVLSEIVIDPDNEANMAVKSSVEAGGAAWAGAYLVVGETAAPEYSLFLTDADPVVSVRVRPDAVGTVVQLKLELATDGGKNVVAQAVTAVADEWETLYFDFSDPIEGAIDASVEYGAIFMIWGGITSGKPAATWYWDDIKHGGISAPGVVPGATISVPVNFEAAVEDYTLIPFDGGSAEVVSNPDTTGNNSDNVLKYVKSADKTWGGFSLRLDTVIDFSAGDVFTVKVWSSAAQDMLFKLDTTNVERTVTTSGNSAWETLTFDFTDVAWGENDKKITMIAANGTMGNGSSDFTFYIDDIALGGAPIGVPVTFEAPSYDLVPFDGGSAEVIANPDASGDNTTANVLKYVKSADKTWGGFSLNLDTAIDFDNGQVFTVQVWSSAAKKMLLKLDGTNVEKEVSTSGGSAWETLSFDFTGTTWGAEDKKITMIGANGTMGDGSDDFTFYIDNITLATSAPAEPVKVPVDFEAEEYNIVPFDGGEAEVLANPDATGINTSANVVKYVKTADKTWAGFTLNLDTAIDFNNGEVFTVKVWSSAAKDILFKLDSSEEELTVATAGGSEWETLVFDFRGKSWDAADRKITMIAGNGTMGDGTADWTFYIDDIQQTDSIPSAPVAVPVDFEAAAYSLVPFDGGSADVIANPDATGNNTSNQVLKYIKSADKTWGGFSLNLDSAIDFSKGEIFTVKVWSSAAKDMLIKFDGSNIEKTVTTAGGSAWETLTFDFSGSAWASEDKKITMIAQNGVMGDGSDAFTFYIDDIAQQ